MNPRQKPVSYTRKEKVQLFNSSLFLGVVMFLFAWRVTEITNILAGIVMLLGFIIISGISLWLFTLVTKYVGYKRGFFITYYRWKSGQIFGVIISILSTGVLPFLFAGTVDIEANKRVRHGKIFPGENKPDIMAISYSGIIILLLFAVFLRLIDNAINTAFTEFAAISVALLALFSLLPLPKSQGGVVFYVNKKNHILYSCVLGLVAIIIIVNSVLWVLLGLLAIVLIVFITRKVKRT